MTKRCFQIYCFIIALIVTLPLALTIVQRVNNKQIISEPELSGVTTIPEESEKTFCFRKMLKLELLYEHLNERGIPLIVRISPSKAEHYPEYLPSGYDRFTEMKQNGEYEANWYQRFLEALAETSIPLYDGYDLMEELKAEGKIVFAKGGTHWTLVPIAEYVNGLNELIEQLLGRKTSRMVIESEEVLVGQMGTSDDSDIWKICWNAISADPDYPSPHISFGTVPGDEPLRVFTMGQSFTKTMLSTIYSIDTPVWDETYFSWYNSQVIGYPSDVPWGTQVSEHTDDFTTYLDMDVIIIDFMESGDGATQFEFINICSDF